jgi:SET family sugar efflux transporter-like MFS transporter
MISGALLGVSQQLGFRWIYGFTLAMCVFGLTLLLVAGRFTRRSEPVLLR